MEFKIFQDNLKYKIEFYNYHYFINLLNSNYRIQNLDLKDYKFLEFYNKINNLIQVKMKQH